MVGPIQVLTFMTAVWDLYTQAGGELVSKEVLEQRFAICEVCPHFNGRGCDLCGCCSNKRKTLFNKLAYPTQHCPDGRWEALTPTTN